MKSLLIRELTTADTTAICHIHRNCDDPWHDETECEAWLSKRHKRGFYLQAAVYEGNIVGHAEWIVSDEPDEKFLYLGMLQVDSDYQKKGIGRAMIADGVRYAKTNGCSTIKTIPDTDTGSEEFYKKCGFQQRRTIVSFTLPAEKDTAGSIGGSVINEVPFEVINEKKFLFGLAQASSRHMWEIANAKPDTDDRLTPAICVEDSYIQLSYFPGDDSALALCWSNRENDCGIFRSALCFGSYCGLEHIRFLLYEEQQPLTGPYQTEVEGFESILKIW